MAWTRVRLRSLALAVVRELVVAGRGAGLAAGRVTTLDARTGPGLRSVGVGAPRGRRSALRGGGEALGLAIEGVELGAAVVEQLRAGPTVALLGGHPTLLQAEHDRKLPEVVLSRAALGPRAVALERREVEGLAIELLAEGIPFLAQAIPDVVFGAVVALGTIADPCPRRCTLLARVHELFAVSLGLH